MPANPACDRSFPRAATTADPTPEDPSAQPAFRLLADTLPQLVWTARPDGHNDWLNRGWYEFTGLAPGSCQGHAWMDVLHPDDLPRTLAAWRDSLATGSLYETEYRLRGADGAYRWFLARGRPVHDAAGRILRWFGTGTDISDIVSAREMLRHGRAVLQEMVAERTRALEAANRRLREEAAQRDHSEARLRQAQKMEAIGQLTGGVAHDFNNLLTAVIGNLELIAAHAPDRRTARLAAGALDVAGRGARLTDRLLAFARTCPFAPAPLDVNALLDGMVPLLGTSLGPAIRLKLVPTEATALARADANQLELAVLNLCINARDAMEAGGELTIATEHRDTNAADGLAPGRCVAIAVTDTGAGMAPEVLQRAMEPFFTTKAAGKGTGLGLSQVHDIAAQCGGSATIDSAPGAGTTVCILLPAADDLPGPVAPRQPAAVPVAARVPRGVRVLLVDDDAVLRELLRDCLTELGCAVTEAADAASGLAKLRQRSRDLLLIDHILPGMSGLDAVREARDLRPGLPILLMTGSIDGMAPAAEAAGVQLLRKPFRLAELRAAIAATLSGATTVGGS